MPIFGGHPILLINYNWKIYAAASLDDMHWVTDALIPRILGGSIRPGYHHHSQPCISFTCVFGLFSGLGNNLAADPTERLIII